MSVVAWVNPVSAKPVKGLIPDTCCGTIVGQREADGCVLRYDGRNAGKEMLLIAQPRWQGHTTLGVPPFAKNTWHHIVGVADNDKLLLYVDGKIKKRMAYKGRMLRNGTSAEIGNSVDHGGFIGIIDEVLIYRKAISKFEIQQVLRSKGLAVEPYDKLTTCWGKIKKAR